MLGFSGRRFLITQISLRNIRGSEMVALELAEYLKSHGARVQVYTREHTGAMADMAKASGIQVIDDPKHPFRFEDYDAIWVHHQLLPPALLAQLADPPAPMPVFVFHHMSSLDSNRMEQPYIKDFERRLAGLSLFISEDAKNKWLPRLGPAHPAALFQNPAPEAFSQYTHTPYPAAPRRVLVVANRNAFAVTALQNLGMQVHVRGLGGGSYCRVLPGDFDGYDAVVTMGKTVQYCLCAGVPVYVYGAYGIPGWLTEDNFEQAARSAFCGRGFPDKKSGSGTAAEIRDGFARALDFQAARRQSFIARFSIGRVLPPLLESVGPRKIEPFSPEYLSYVTEAGR